MRDLIPMGSVDQLVAFVAEDSQAILISHDGDFQKISPRVPDGQQKRFKNLSRIHLRCEEYNAAMRLEIALTLIQHEFEIAQSKKDKRMIIQIGKAHIRSDR